MRSFIIASICLVIALVTLPAFAQKPVPGGSLTVCTGVDLLDWIQRLAFHAIPRIVYGNVVEGLVRIDRDGQIAPGLAEKFTMTRDGKEYTFS